MNQDSKVNIAQKFSLFNDLWNPRIVAELNGQHVKLGKVQGEFVWHRHENEDELFLVFQGKLELHLRDRIVHLDPGEFYVVPRGVEHKPVAHEETHILMLEPTTTLNTGDVSSERTVPDPAWI
ncbi:MAG: mannose-6-phosphate isomerase-like protein (cupin superfamily) [Rhodothermales bacterium]|jgi:mannose-6-phosphate isomerase-like protein (cupin superfamily)